MFKITLSGEVGWEIMAFMVREKLSEAGSQDVEVDLSSPGGSVFEGIEIFNLFREYKRENPNSEMILNIKSEAASMGSYLASNEVFSLVTIEDNSTFMIHNPLMGVYGDYQEMEKGADFLKRLALMMAPVYANRSKKSVSEIKLMMDSETWLFGEEIVNAGFADEIIKTDIVIDKTVAIAQSELKLKSVMKKIRETQAKESDFEKVAAIMNDKPKASKPANGGNNNNQEVIMNLDELKAKHPELYAEILSNGIEQGVKQEKERVKSLLEMKSKKDFEKLDTVKARIEDGIKNGETMSAVEIGVMAELKKDTVQASIESPSDINTIDPNATVSGEKKTDVEMKAEEAEKENQEW